MHYLGFDIGGSSIKAVLVKDKQIVKSEIINLPDSLAGLLASLAVLKQELEAGVEKEIGGAGFAVAGVLDLPRETMLKSRNIAYLDGQPLAELFGKLSGPYPVKIEHDVHCFLLAEKEVGLAKNFKDVFYVTLGTGIGGAWMAEGKIFHGGHGAAGEVGRLIVDEAKMLDLEEQASDKFIRKSLGIGSVEAMQRARAGDTAAQEVFRQAGENLGLGLADIINIFDPETVILNGGVAEAKEFILPGILDAVSRLVLSPAAQKTEILFSQLGRLGGALGAALLFEQT